MGHKKQESGLPGPPRQSMLNLDCDVNVNSVNSGGGYGDGSVGCENDGVRVLEDGANSNLRVWSFNAQSLCNKFVEFRESIDQFKPKIIGICESWINDGIPEGDYKIEGYKCYMKNRERGRGGGVMIYVDEKLESYECDWMNDVGESCWCYIKSGCDKILVGIVYRSPNSSQLENRNIINGLERVRGVRSILLLGDFNYPNIDWRNGMVRGGGRAAVSFYEEVQQQYLCQHVLSPTRIVPGEEPTILDLVFTREENMVQNLEIVSPLGRSDHSGLLFDFIPSDRSNIIEESDSIKKNYFKGNYNLMRSELEDINWDELFESNEVEIVCQNLESLIKDMAQRLIPERRVSKHKEKVPKSIKKAAKKKRELHKRYRMTARQEDWEAYRRQRNATTELIKNYEREKELKLARDFKENPKLLHNFVRSKMKVKDRIGPLENSEGEVCCERKMKAKLLNDQFKSVFVRENLNNIPEVERTVVNITDVLIDEEIVKKKLSKLKEDKAMGPDEIHPKILRECSEQLAGPLARLFRMSLSDGVVPESWRRANVSPIFKKGSMKKVENYRPVSLTSQLCKVMESIIRDHLVEFLERESFFAEEQHGFRAKRSCTTNLLETFEDWTCAADRGCGVDCIYLDFQKAFDTVPHQRLLTKLEACGVGGDIGNWIAAFLRNREQRVVVDGEMSDWTRVLSGVPQGSILGPVLFLIYINDIPGQVGSKVKLFADDTKLYKVIEGKEDRLSLQSDLCSLCEWSKKWQLKFNIEKCKSMHVGDNGGEIDNYYMVSHEGERIDLQEVTEEKDLGVVVKSDLRWTDQCSGVIGRATGAMRKLKTSFKHMDVEIFKRVYPSYVRSHLENSVQVWSPHLLGDIDRLEKVQRRATKSVRGLRDYSYEERLKMLKLHSLSKRRLRGDLIEVFKMVRGLSGLKFDDFFQYAEQGSTRGHRFKLFKMRSNFNKRLVFFSQRVINEWNGLNESVVEAESVNTFKNRLDGEWERSGYGYTSR